MKKRSLVLVLVLAMLMSLCACAGKESKSVVGTWKANYDFSEMMQESMGAEADTYGDVFEDLSLTFCFEFTKEEVTISVDEASIDDFKDAMEDIMVKIFDISMEEMAKSAGMTVDEVYSSIGYTREEYLETFLDEMDIDSLAEELVVEETSKYKAGKDVITVTNEDGDIEEWAYTLDGDSLTLTVDMDGEEAVFNCKRQ